METLPNNNPNNDNGITLDENALIIIDNPKCKKRLQSTRSLYRDPKCEGLHKGIIEALMMSGVAHDHIQVTPECPRNGWAILCDNTRKH